MVSVGLKPTTFGTGIRRSIQLSYEIKVYNISEKKFLAFGLQFPHFTFSFAKIQHKSELTKYLIDFYVKFNRYWRNRAGIGIVWFVCFYIINAKMDLSKGKVKARKNDYMLKCC